jgi:hypothetical protein
MLIDAVAECQHRSVDLFRLTPSGGRETPPPPRGNPLPMHSHRTSAPANRHNSRQIADHHLHTSSCQARCDTPRNLQKDTEPAREKHSTTDGKPTPALQNRQAKNDVLSRLSPSFVLARRRRMARRFYPTPNEMNVKRGSKPTAETTKNQRKT